MHSNAPMKVVSVVDTAVDIVGMGRDGSRYMRTRDFDLVKTHPGMEPTVFYLQRIDSAAFSALVTPQPTESLKYREAFRLAVTGIDNLVDETSGQTIRAFAPSDRRQLYGNAIQCLSDDDLLKVAPIYVEEIGQVALMRSFLSRASALSLHPPPLLLAAYTARLSSLGAAAIAAARSHEPSLKSDAPAEPDLSPKAGDRATAATATE